ncbi:MAG: STAS domain-containing protein [Acidobacteriota bacterium]
MKLKTECHQDVYFIIPEGELLAGQGDSELKEELDRLRIEGKKRVVVDFSQVPYIDSSILGQLVHGYSVLKKEGGGLKLLSPSKRIIDVLTLTRLITVFEIFQNRDEAIASWSS